MSPLEAGFPCFCSSTVPWSTGRVATQSQGRGTPSPHIPKSLMEHCHWNTEPFSRRRGYPDFACQPPGPNVCSSLSKTQPTSSSSSQHYSGGKVTYGLRRNRLSGTWVEAVRRREKTFQASGNPEESFQAIHKPWSQPGSPREGRVCNTGSGKPLTRVTPSHTNTRLCQVD